MLKEIQFILGRLSVEKSKWYDRLFDNANRAYYNCKDPNFKLFWLDVIKIIDQRRTKFQLSNRSRIIN
jgi:phosphate-selective porin